MTERKQSGEILLNYSDPGRLTLRFSYGQTAMKQLFTVPLLPIIATLLSVTFLFIGTGSSSVICERSSYQANCIVNETSILGVYERLNTVRDVQKAELRKSQRDGNILSQRVIVGTDRTVPILTGASNTQLKAKERIVANINHWLKQSNAVSFQAEMSRWNIFGILGLLLTVIALLSWWSAIMFFFFPPFFDLDRQKNIATWRSGLLQGRAKSIPVDSIAGFRLKNSHNFPVIEMVTRDGRGIVFGRWFQLLESETTQTIETLCTELGLQDEVAQPKGEDGFWSNIFSEFFEVPEFSSLPITIAHGSTMQRKFAAGVLTLAVVILGYVTYVFMVDGVIELFWFALPIFLMVVAWRNLRIDYYYLDSNGVRVKHCYMLHDSEWTEPLQRYAGLYLEEREFQNNSQVHTRTQVFLKHKTDPKRDLRLLKMHAEDRKQVLDLSKQAASLLSLPILPTAWLRTTGICPESKSVTASSSQAHSASETIPNNVLVLEHADGTTEVRLVGVPGNMAFVIICSIFLVAGVGVILGGLSMSLNTSLIGGLMVIIFGVIFSAVTGLLLALILWAENCLLIESDTVKHLGRLGTLSKQAGELRLEQVENIELVRVYQDKGKQKTLVRIYGADSHIDYADNASPETAAWVHSFLNEAILQSKEKKNSVGE